MDKSWLFALLLLLSVNDLKAESPYQSNNFLVEEITEENFYSKTQERPTLIDFYAPWCGSCIIFEPTFVKIAQEMRERVIFYKVNIDTSWNLLEQYEIVSIPTLIFFKDGREINRHEGELPENSLKAFIYSNL
ncbi:thioredoxin family protein [Parachlamydia acanthamoebae]|uniref:Thioredoxin n=2 Tax=Parachlamydia acanthamoebae TaxID=83552 RepID=F8KXE3_PARAV|nr:thioredoxin domain-containing protein [Parachlamydia acanthamoebae]CCB85624.1 thioredoxin [Parachlamydia acanthamoebae UV-7]